MATRADQYACPAPAGHTVVRLSNALERNGLVDRDRESALTRRRGEVGGGFLLDLWREVVTAQETEADALEEHRPERHARALGARGVGGDHSLVRGDRRIEVGVVGERSLDDSGALAEEILQEPAERVSQATTLAGNELASRPAGGSRRPDGLQE
ncbi:MAG: hypothetical protein U0T02_05580 [Solirubrobacteraceae bacterium]